MQVTLSNPISPFFSSGSAKRTEISSARWLLLKSKVDRRLPSNYFDVGGKTLVANLCMNHGRGVTMPSWKEEIRRLRDRYISITSFFTWIPGKSLDPYRKIASFQKKKNQICVFKVRVPRTQFPQNFQESLFLVMQS